MRKLAWFLIVSSVLAVIAEFIGWRLPTISWAFNLSHEGERWGIDIGGKEKLFISLFGFFIAIMGIALGLLLLKKFAKGIEMLPTTLRRIERFRSNKRGLI